MVCFGRGEHHAQHWVQYPPRPHAPASDAGRSGADRAHDAADHIELRDWPLPPGRRDAAAARGRARCRAHGAAGRDAARRRPPGGTAQAVHHGGRHARADRAVGIPARSLPPAVPARRQNDKIKETETIFGTLNEELGKVGSIIEEVSGKVSELEGHKNVIADAVEDLNRFSDQNVQDGTVANDNMKELQSAMADCRLSTGKVNKVSNELVGKIKNLGDQTAKRMNAIDG